MSIQSFIAANQGLAFEKVRTVLGADAVILEVRQRGALVEVLAKSGVPRQEMAHFFSARRVIRRALAAGGGSVLPAEGAEATPTSANEAPGALFSKSGRPALPSALGANGPTASGANWDPDGTMSDIQARRSVPAPAHRADEGLLAPEDALASFVDALELPRDIHDRLVQAGGSGSLEQGLRQLHGWLERKHRPLVPRPRPSNGPVQLGFIGPECVGRSTLVRGLATRVAMEHPGRVLWVQASFPRRPAPVRGPLYVPIGVDFCTVQSEEEFVALAEDYADMQAILFDLPGIRIHRGVERRALARFLRAAEHAFGLVQWSAVLPLTWSVREISRALDALGSFRTTGVAWTFEDQSADAVGALAAAVRCGKAPSFLHGDSVGDGRSTRSARWDEILSLLSITNHAGEGER